MFGEVGLFDGMVMLDGTLCMSDNNSVSALLYASLVDDSWDAEASSTCGLV
jgi:hypothetical protein